MSTADSVSIHFNYLKAAGYKHGGWLATVASWSAPKSAPVLSFAKDWDIRTCTAKTSARPGQVLLAGCGSHGSESKVPVRLKFRHFYIVQRSHQRRLLVARVLQPNVDARGLFLRSQQAEMAGTTYPVPTVLDGSRETTKHLARAVNEELDQLGFKRVGYDSEAPGASAKALLERVRAALENWPEFELRLAHYRLLLVAVVEAREQIRAKQNEQRVHRKVELFSSEDAGRARINARTAQAGAA